MDRFIPTKMFVTISLTIAVTSWDSIDPAFSQVYQFASDRDGASLFFLLGIWQILIEEEPLIGVCERFQLI